ncbi:MAG: glycosyltransferase [Rikenellaceae bacterium]
MQPSLRIGGAEKLMTEILPRLRDMGGEVELVLFCGVQTSFKQQLLEQGIKITDLSSNGSVYNPKYILKLCKYIKEFDIVHTHNTSPQYFAAIARLFTRGRAKFVTTEHNTHNRRRDIWGAKLIDKFLYRRYDSIISISQKATDNLTEYLGESRGVVTINNGIDIDRYYNAQPLDREQSLKIPNNVILLTKVAGFREQKDHDTVIRSLKHLTSNIHIAFVGDGVRREACEELTQQLEVSDRVHFLGLRSDVPEILKSSDIVVMSSHWEGLSLSSVEGMAAGKPMIASDVQGLREVVGGAGILFKHGDDKALADEIIKLVEDKDYYNTVSESCQERAKQYDINIMVEKYYREYQKLLK